MVARRASIETMVAAGRLIAQRPDRVALEQVVASADRDVLAADANLRSFSPWADTMLYEAGLRASRVIVQAAGFRIDSGAGAHITAIDAADALTDRRHHTVFTRLHRMRRRRNTFMYETTPDPSELDLAQARVDVQALIEAARFALDVIDPPTGSGPTVPDR